MRSFTRTHPKSVLAGIATALTIGIVSVSGAALIGASPAGAGWQADQNWKSMAIDQNTAYQKKKKKKKKKRTRRGSFHG